MSSFVFNSVVIGDNVSPDINVFYYALVRTFPSGNLTRADQLDIVSDVQLATNGTYVNNIFKADGVIFNQVQPGIIQGICLIKQQANYPGPSDIPVMFSSVYLVSIGEHLNLSTDHINGLFAVDQTFGYKSGAANNSIFGFNSTIQQLGTNYAHRGFINPATEQGRLVVLYPPNYAVIPDVLDVTTNLTDGSNTTNFQKAWYYWNTPNQSLFIDMGVGNTVKIGSLVLLLNYSNATDGSFNFAVSGSNTIPDFATALANAGGGTISDSNFTQELYSGQWDVIGTPLVNTFANQNNSSNLLELAIDSSTYYRFIRISGPWNLTGVNNTPTLSVAQINFSRTVLSCQTPLFVTQPPSGN